MKISCYLIVGCLMAGAIVESRAATTVNAGSINQVAGPGSLDLTNVLYAVNFNQEFGTQTVNGVTFVNDTAPPVGFSSVGPQNVTNWQTKPEFGATASDNALEEIYSDIRWTNAAVDPPLQANMDVTPGLQYRLQILFYGNHAADDRRWDITVDGLQAVDDISSLGIATGPGLAGLPAYSANRGLVYRYDFFAPDAQVNVSMGQLFGTFEGTDPNAIWQGITLSRIPEPSIFALSAFAVVGLLRRRRFAS